MSKFNEYLEAVGKEEYKEIIEYLHSLEGQELNKELRTKILEMISEYGKQRFLKGVKHTSRKLIKEE